MAGTIADKILIAVGIDLNELKAGLNQAVNTIKNHAQNLGAQSNKLSNQVANDQNNIANGLKNVSNHTNNATNQAINASKAFASMSGICKSAITSLIKSIAAPLASAITLGSVFKTYFNGVAQVAQMTGAYSTKMEEWRKKKALLSRVNREDIILYKKAREAVFKYQMAMADLSTRIMRGLSPAMKWIIDLLNKFSAWVSRNQNNIVRFITILAVVLTARLLPAIVKITLAMLANPITWIIAGFIALIAVIDDLVVWLKGGKSALGGFWQLFGSREKTLARINALLQFFRNHLREIVGVVIGVVSAFAGWGIIQATLIGIGKAIAIAYKAFTLLKGAIVAVRVALTALAANPIIAFLMLILGLVLWITNAFKRAGGDWSKVWDILCQDVTDFLNIFWGLGDVINNFQAKAVKWFKDIGSAVKEWFTDKINAVSESWTEFCKLIESWYNKIIGWFNDIGQSIKDAFSFDGIKEKTKNALSSLNPANWKIFGGGSDALEAGNAATSSNVSKSYSSSSNRTTVNNIAVNTNNERVAGAVIASAQESASNDLSNSVYSQD